MLRDKLLSHPKLLLFIAFLLMLFGVVMPFLMVIKVVESTFFWNFLSYISSTLGILLGVVAMAASHLVNKHKSKKDDDIDRYR